MDVRAENCPDIIVRAVGDDPWGCHKPGTGRAGGIWGTGGALVTLRPSRTDIPLYSCGIVVSFVVVVTSFLMDGDIDDNGGKSKGFESRFGMGIENCSLIFRTLAICASI
jgi:hypothetical protein